MVGEGMVGYGIPYHTIVMVWYGMVGAPAQGPEPRTGYWPPGPPVRHEAGRPAAGGAGAPGGGGHQLQVEGGQGVRRPAGGAQDGDQPATLPGRPEDTHHPAYPSLV